MQRIIWLNDSDTDGDSLHRFNLEQSCNQPRHGTLAVQITPSYKSDLARCDSDLTVKVWPWVLALSWMSPAAGMAPDSMIKGHPVRKAEPGMLQLSLLTLTLMCVQQA